MYSDESDGAGDGSEGETVGKAVGQGVDTVLNAGAKILSGKAPWSGGGREKKVGFVPRRALSFANHASQSQSPEKGQKQQQSRVSTSLGRTEAQETNKTLVIEQESRKVLQGELAAHTYRIVP